MNTAVRTVLAAGITVCAAILSACGPDQACVLVEVRWQGYSVPMELDALHFVLSDTEGVFVERSLDLPAEAPPATLQLCQGLRTPDLLQLVVHGLLNARTVVQAPAVEVDFTQADATVHVQLPPP
ncbi:MAG: hypothetical protein ABIJ09_13200 [Pseudomonadota bacterium]